MPISPQDARTSILRRRSSSRLGLRTLIDIASLVPQIVSAHPAASRIPMHFIRDSPLNATGLSDDEFIPLAIVIGELLTHAAKRTTARGSPRLAERV